MMTRHSSDLAWSTLALPFVGILVLTIATPPARVATVAQVPTDPLVQAGDLAYVGAFRLPRVNGGAYAYGGTAVSLRPDGTTLLVVSHDRDQLVGEVRVPTPGTGPDVASLPVATSLIAPRDVLRGKLHDISPTSTNILRIGGTLPLADGGLIVTALDSYDATMLQTAGHFHVSPDGMTVTLQQVGPVGFTAGWLVPVPAAWQAALKTTMLSGACCVSIISRTSMGPALSAWTQFPGPELTTALRLGYPIGHQTIGSWEVPSALMHGATIIHGAIWPAGTRSILFVGRFGANYCYGGGVSDPTQHNTVDPVTGHKRCYDPIYPYQGSHAYPYEARVWAYDATDLAAVAAGAREPWDVRPYATWPLTHPFASPHQEPLGIAYDAATRLAYVPLMHGDGDHPVIHTWRLTASGTPPPPPPPPPPTPPLTGMTLEPRTGWLTLTYDRTSDPRLAGAGWTLQFQRSRDGVTWLAHGTRKVQPPYQQRTAVPCDGPYDGRAVWTAPGQSPIVVPLGSRRCTD